MSEKKFVYTTEVTGEIVQIPIERLFSHPNNVRDDVGDISELAESIKAKGILQNLTVVPSEKVNGYFVVIGNRRLAAAREAGLETLPCVIANMTYAEQIETMLLENIQRTDLTPVEQAAGFQMMIDLGDTVAEISRKTGFGETTIRRRLEVAKLDRKKLKEAIGERQISMFDLDRLSQIENVKKRNELLDVIGTENFNYRIRGVINEEKVQKNLPLVKKALDELGAKAIKKEDRWSSKYESASSYIYISDWDPGKGFDIKPKAGEELFYYLDTSDVQFFRKRKKAAPEKRSKKELEAEAAARQIERRLREATERSWELRREFENGLKITAANRDKWLGWCAKLMAIDITEYYSRGRCDACGILGIDPESYKSKGKDDLPGLYIDVNKRRAMIYSAIDGDVENVKKMILAFLSDSAEEDYVYTYEAALHDGIRPKYNYNHKLDLIYEFICDFGYEMSDEEKKMQSGAPELFGAKE